MDQKASLLCFYFNSSRVIVTGQTFNKNCCWNYKNWTRACIIGEATTLGHARTGASAILSGGCPRWECTTIVARQIDCPRMDLTRRVWKCLEFVMDLHKQFSLFRSLEIRRRVPVGRLCKKYSDQSGSRWLSQLCEWRDVLSLVSVTLGTMRE